MLLFVLPAIYLLKFDLVLHLLLTINIFVFEAVISDYPAVKPFLTITILLSSLLLSTVEILFHIKFL